MPAPWELFQAVCRTNSSVFLSLSLSFSSSPKLARMTQPRHPFLQAPHHTLRSFNYLMQDAGIMLGRHLKEVPAFIYWDGSSVRREERGLLECHEACLWFLQRHTYPCLFLPLSLAFSFFLFLAACLQYTLHHHIFLPFRGGMKAPRRPKVTGRVDRSTWGEATTVISHFSACCSQVYTPGTCCTVSSLCVSATLNKVEPFKKGSVKITARTRNVNVNCTALWIKHQKSTTTKWILTEEVVGSLQ